MGWRQGQGIGPKTSKAKKKKRPKKSLEEPNKTQPEPTTVDQNLTSNNTGKVYGCVAPPSLLYAKNQQSDSDSESSMEIDENILISPDDVDSPLCNPKDNRFGLGYTGLDKSSMYSSHIDLFGPKLQGKVDNRKLNITGQVKHIISYVFIISSACSIKLICSYVSGFWCGCIRRRRC